ncbi:undecaprenyldiphospho-muramoylpentapeptide beta-N-acetylglucosaminyltransferase [Chelatococcus reniformis]|uniref:UDP-N-acetylglucosamine--N-acetylmuramyl-(pentapeptide) pyrophosphoryl-undecaprenol N-acetylglucosamine transferase n=1 Tax=Chelatococcus reniformis TaxID=1494448 RepID=A0A916XE48_9HYPH|nr:undecaprenyldiphospho-muramoylpentapeptide beta-N-acetylglucosaminyltransferase [Chelatococcus reniformis]GGC67230.1 UDP-N-acetylglucosamine--N-acetylmuramyl-(pentapeptide) pyrophosphoryl-undecaprenol N-acetylglucosamine transferase [Chelatococcus reniformis]
MRSGGLVVLAAGGTGGHLFPAQALAEALAARGVRVALATDTRVSGHVAAFPAEAIYEISSATPSRKSLPVMAKAALTLGRGIWTARGLMRRIRPALVVGFGGYPSVPPLLAATMVGAPTIIHEQNAVLGRANRFLAGRVTAIATGFAAVGGLTDDLRAKARHVGNPVRPPVIAAATEPLPPLGGAAPLRLVVFGGSQGARVMSEIVPSALALLPAEQRGRLAVTQQARPEDLEQVRATYRDLGIGAVVEAFFTDLPARIAAGHLVVARSGASTVAELGVIGRASILVPLPGSLDQDQAANAATLAAIGAATVIPQPEFTPERLAADIAARLADPAGLTRAAEAAKSAGIPDAAERLAALVVDMAR